MRKMKAREKKTKKRVRQKMSDNTVPVQDSFVEKMPEQSMLEESILKEAEGATRSGEQGDFSAQFDRIEEQLSNLADLFDKRIKKTKQEEIVLKQYSDEIQEYREGLYKQIIKPLLMEFIDLRENILKTAYAVNVQRGGDSCGDARNFEIFAQMIEDTLVRYDVEISRPCVGDVFQSQVASIAGRETTLNRELHNTIAEVSSDSYSLDGRCIKKSLVKVFVYEERN